MKKNDSLPMTLEDLRREIDRLDRSILTLLVDRFDLTSRVAATKHDGLIFRPGREADLLRRLQDESKDLLDPRLVESLWRQVIAFSLAGQKQLVIAHPKSDEMAASARYRFGEVGVYLSTSNASEVLGAVEAGEADLGVLPHWEDDGWWRDLADRRHAGSMVAIAAITPITPTSSITPSVVVARHMPDPSSQDVTVCHADGAVFTCPGYEPDREDALGIFQQS